MLKKICAVRNRLSKAAGKAWLETAEYMDKTENWVHDPHYRELADREEILCDAVRDIDAAIKIIRIFEGDDQ